MSATSVDRPTTGVRHRPGRDHVTEHLTDHLQTADRRPTSAATRPDQPTPPEGDTTIHHDIATRAQDDYIVEFHRELMRELTGRHRHRYAEDVVQSETLTVIERIDIIRETYPDPATYARVRARHAGIDHDRRQAAQRGHGSRIVRHADGTVTFAREVVSGDVPDPTTGLTIFDTLHATDTDPAEVAIDKVMVRNLVTATLMALPPRARQLLVMVKVHQLSVTDAAALLGIDRASASRLLHRTLDAVYAAHERYEAERSAA